MDNYNNHSKLTLEEMIATSAVFVLAGAFLWHYFAKDDNTTESALTAPSVFQSDRTTLQAGDIKQNPPPLKYSAKSSMTTQEANSYPAQKPFQALQTTQSKSRKKQFEYKTAIPSSQDLVALNQATPQKATDRLTSEISRPTATDAATAYPTQAARQEIAPNPQNNNATQTVINQLNQTGAEEQSKSDSILPVIDPVKNDITQVLRLQGTATPNGQVVLFLNGSRVSSIIQVNSSGQWQYETDIKPGKYTVRIIDDDNLTQSENLQIVVPATPPESQAQKSVTIPKAKQTQRTVTTNALKGNKASGNRQHRVKAGDTLYDLSIFYHVTATEITQANNLSAKALLEIDQVLVIPNPSQP